MPVAGYLRVKDIHRQIRLSRPAIYSAISRGELQAIRYGRAVLVSEAAVERWLSEHFEPNGPRCLQRPDLAVHGEVRP